MKIGKTSIALMASAGAALVLSAAASSGLLNLKLFLNDNPYTIEGPGLGNLEYQDHEVMRGGVGWVTTESSKGANDGDVPYNAHIHNAKLKIPSFDPLTGLPNLDASGNQVQITKTMGKDFGTNVGVMINGYFVTMFAPDSGNPGGGLLIYDISDPRHIRLVKRIYDVKVDSVTRTMTGTTSEFREPHAIGTAIVDGRRYLAIPSVKGIEFWDFTSIDDVKQVGKVTIPGVEGGDYGNVNWQMAWQSPYLYVSGANNGIYIVDATDPKNPKMALRGGKPVTVNPGISPGPIFVVGNQLVVTGMNNNSPWVSLDISDPLSPVPLAAQPIDGNTYYASCFDGLNVFPATRYGFGKMFGFNLENPSVFKAMDKKLVVHDSLYCATQDNFVFQGAQHKVHKIDISDPLNFVQVVEGSKNPTFNVNYATHNSDQVTYSAESVANIQQWYDSNLLHPWTRNEVGNGTVAKLLLNSPSSNAARDNHAIESHRVRIADHGQVTPLGNLIYVGEDHGGGNAFMVHQKTKDLTPPSVRNLSPKAGSANQATTSRVGVAMTDMIQLESVNNKTVVVRRKDTGAQIDGHYTVQLGLINFSPKVLLEAGTTYEVELPQGGVKDYAGNGLAQKYSYTFTTATGGATTQNLEYRWRFTNNLHEDVIGLQTSTSNGGNAVFSPSGGLRFSPTETNRGVKFASSVPDSLKGSKLPPHSLLTQSASMSFYLKTTQVGSNDAWSAPGIYGKDQVGAFNDSFWGYIDGSGRLVFQLGNDYKVDSGMAINDGIWHHIVMSRSAETGKISMFVDGGLPANGGSGRENSLSTPILGIIGAGTLPKTLGEIEGNLVNGNPVVLRGELADLRIFSKVFTAGDAQTLYAEGLMDTSSVARQGNVGTPLNFQPTTISAAAGTTYSWNFGANSPATPFSASPNATYSFARAGRYNVTLTRKDARGIEGLPETFSVSVVNPVTLQAPMHSTNITGNAAHVYSVNPDSGTVTAIDANTYAKVWETKVGKEPRTLAIGPGGEVWVTVQGDDKVVILSADGSIRKTHDLGYGSGPYGIVFNSSKTLGLLTLENKSSLVRFEPSAASLEALTKLVLPGFVRGVAINGGSSDAFVTRFISANSGGALYKVNLSANTVQTIGLQVDTTTQDSEAQSRGVPNYLHQVVISPDGKRAILPSKKDNITTSDLTPETTVRSVVSFVDLDNNSEAFSEQVDFNNSAAGRAAVYSPRGDYIFVAQMEGNSVAVIDAHNRKPRPLFFGNDAERAPHGLYLDGATGRLYVNNFLGRSVSVYDVSSMLLNGALSPSKVTTVATVAIEPLTPTELAGKKIFYNAADARMSLNNYMSCASCHTDGGHDGMTWDFTARGQGKRSNIPLQGRAGIGHGNVHWTGNFDEIQDFENDIRMFFGGNGFMSNTDFEASKNTLGANKKTGKSRELDDLSAYVSSLGSYPRSPNRNTDGSFTSQALVGKKVFDNQNCVSCHSGASRQDNGLKNLTEVQVSLLDLGATAGIDTPTLEGVWNTAPYFHDGRANTLRDIFASYNHGITVAVTAADTDALVAYLNSLDGAEENHWPLKSDVKDIARGNNGQVNVPSAAFTLDGVDLSQLSSGVPLLNESTGKILGGTSSLSFSIKTQEFGSNTRWNAPGVFGYEEYGGTDDIFWGYIDANGHMAFAAGNSAAVKTSAPINNNAWQHIVMTRNAKDGQIAIYVNGVLSESALSKTGQLGKEIFKTIGLIEHNVGSPKIRGVLKDVRVFASALKLNEVQALYAKR